MTDAEIKIQKYLDQLDLARLEADRDLDMEGHGESRRSALTSRHNTGKRPRWNDGA